MTRNSSYLFLCLAGILTIYSWATTAQVLALDNYNHFNFAELREKRFLRQNEEDNDDDNDNQYHQQSIRALPTYLQTFDAEPYDQNNQQQYFLEEEDEEEGKAPEKKRNLVSRFSRNIKKRFQKKPATPDKVIKHTKAYRKAFQNSDVSKKSFQKGTKSMWWLISHEADIEALKSSGQIGETLYNDALSIIGIFKKHMLHNS